MMTMTMTPMRDDGDCDFDERFHALSRRFMHSQNKWDSSSSTFTSSWFWSRLMTTKTILLEKQHQHFSIIHNKKSFAKEMTRKICFVKSALDPDDDDASLSRRSFGCAFSGGEDHQKTIYAKKKKKRTRNTR